MNNPNKDILDRQFLEPVAEVAGIKLQPFSPGILTATRALGLKLIAGTDDEKKAMTEADRQFELMAVLWMLANDRHTVLKAVAGGLEEVTRKVREFEYLIPFSELPRAVEAIASIVAQANAAAVETVPKPHPHGDGGAPAEPPNS